MESLADLLKNNDHQKIMLLPSPEFDEYKAIAAIHLELYDDALVFAKKGSFELAYIHYRLKKYKKSLKILRKLHGENVDVLKSQCLYFLGYYSEAYNLLQPVGQTDEYAVNLLAMESLNVIERKNHSKPSLFTSGNTNIDLIPCKFHFTDSECQVESEFNRVYRYIENEEEYIDIMRKMCTMYNVSNNCFQNQLSNLLLEGIKFKSRTENKIADFNLGKINSFGNSILFQKNFLPGAKTDYTIFKEFQLNKVDFYKGIRSFNSDSKRLRLLKAFILAKRNNPAKWRHIIMKTMPGCDENICKDALMLFGLEISENEFQKRALKVIEHYK